jgi:hypothetical protein
MSRASEFKTDANSRRYLRASYIMRKDPDARAAYEAMRRRGVTRADAETAIEFACLQCFREKLLFDRDRRLEGLAIAAGGTAGGSPLPRSTFKAQTELARLSVECRSVSGTVRPSTFASTAGAQAMGINAPGRLAES